MGQLFSQLTKTGVYNPDTGATAWGTPGQSAITLAQQQTRQLQPDQANLSDSGNVSFAPQDAQFSRMVHPTPQQAAQVGATPGGANAMSPALTKGGKLATLLMSGLQGALAGRAASEQAVIQSGGRRSGGAGTGFQAGYTLPWQRATQLADVQKTQAEAGLAQAGLQPVETPYGQMPAALASKILTPYLGYQGRIGAAQIGGQSRVQSADIGAQGRVQAAEVTRRFIPVQGVGLFDTANRQVVPGTAQSITVTPDIAQDYQLPQEFIGKPMTLSNLAAVERAQSQQNTTVQGEAGPALVNKRSGQVRSLGLGNPGMGRPIQVGDVNNPGETVTTTGGQAVRSGAPGTQSASVQVPRAAAKAEVPTKIGDQKVAFNTALQHADLLKQALTALNDPQNPSNVRALNSLSNRFRTEFGSPDVTNFQAIANAYTREITKMLSAGHMTNEEIATNGATLPANASPKQILGVIDNYKSLATSKLNMLNQQKQNAIQQAQPRGRQATSANDPFNIR